MVGPLYTTNADECARNWIHSLCDWNLDKLARMTWARAIAASERWHAAMLRKAERRAAIAEDQRTEDRIESVESHY